MKRKKKYENRKLLKMFAWTTTGILQSSIIISLSLQTFKTYLEKLLQVRKTLLTLQNLLFF